MFCNESGQSAPMGLCDPGWYCPAGSKSIREVDCPLGYYCPLGSDQPDPCRNGTYGNAINLKAQDECTWCDPGFFCNETGATTVSGQCHAGLLNSYCRSVRKKK